ncbi:hypothetical protein AB0I72_02260 [Nocardiopsis sp. NPDC049922]|uniref:hypothetical protein n=1 Tax=Nocardiopsis sp. NPDC049922 TaxID=3155157 RepID=UPI00340985A3
MRTRTVRRAAAALLAAPMLALTAPAVASAEQFGGVVAASPMSHGFGHGGFHGGFGHGGFKHGGFGHGGFHRGFGHGFHGGAFFAQSGSFAGLGGASSFNVISFAR